MNVSIVKAVSDIGILGPARSQELAHQIAKNGKPEWLVEDGGGAEQVRLLVHFRASERGDEHDGQRGMRSTNGGEHPEPVAARHFDVRNQEGRWPLFRRSQRFE